MTASLLAEGLMTQGDPPHLIGGQPLDGGPIVFPFPSGSEGARYTPVALGRHGALWSYTVQRFRPKSPPYLGAAAFEPYAVGYVELPGEVIVESRIVGVAFDAMRIGMSVSLVVVPVCIDSTGATRSLFAFAPPGFVSSGFVPSGVAHG